MKTVPPAPVVPPVLRDLRCAVCNYGVTVDAPTRCPMCGGASWQRKVRH